MNSENAIFEALFQLIDLSFNQINGEHLSKSFYIATYIVPQSTFLQ